VEALEAAEVSRRLARPVLLDEVGSDDRLARLSGRDDGHNGSWHRPQRPSRAPTAAESARYLVRSEAR
jgi:hypothetical protein